MKSVRFVIDNGPSAGAAIVTACTGGGEAFAAAERAPTEADQADLLASACDAILVLAAKLDGKVPLEEVVVVLHPPLVQLRTLRGLPPVGSRDLTRLVEEQKERFFRAASEGSVVSAQWVSRARDATVANAALAETEVLETIEAAMRGCGLGVSHFVASRDSEDGGLTFCTAFQARERQRARHRTMAAALTLVAMGWLAPPVTYVADLARDHGTLQSQLIHADSAMVRVDSLEARMTAFSEVASPLRRQGPDSAWAAVSLAEIATRIPGNVHLHAIELTRDGVVRLRAHSGDATDGADSILARFQDSRVQEDEPVGELIVELGAGL